MLISTPGRPLIRSTRIEVDLHYKAVQCLKRCELIDLSSGFCARAAVTSHRSGLARRVAPPVCGSFLCGSFHPPKLAQPGPSQLVSFNTARPARPSAARIIHQSSTSSALRSLSHQPQFAQSGPSQLVSFTTARLARPFAARLIHHSSPSPDLRSSSHSSQLAQLSPLQLVSFTIAGQARPFTAGLIHRPSQLAQPDSSRLVSSTTARPA